jgi:hypothetical protein
MTYPFTGGGDPLGFPRLPAGGGDPLPSLINPWPTMGLGGSNELRRLVAALPFTVTAAHNFAPAHRTEDGAIVVGEEGGYYLQVTSTVENYFEVAPEVLPHMVQLVDSTGQTWPLTEPACHGGVPTLAYVLIPRANGRILRFASPRAPEGLYAIKVSRPDGWSVTLDSPELQVRVVPTAFSREVGSVRAMFPSDVYNPYPD